jgi:hypothetical protein
MNGRELQSGPTRTTSDLDEQKAFTTIERLREAKTTAIVDMLAELPVWMREQVMDAVRWTFRQ